MISIFFMHMLRALLLGLYTNDRDAKLNAKAGLKIWLCLYRFLGFLI